MRYVNILFWTGLLSLSACITDQGKESSQFGAQYNLLQTSSLPSLSNDTLHIRVSYSGCSGNHAFTIRHSIKSSSTTEIWLFKETPDQPCDAYFEEEKTYLLPENIRSQQNIVLVGPYGKRFTLRP